MTAFLPLTVPRSPTQWDCEAFSSPAQVDQIIGFCATYVAQLRPLITFEHATAVMTTAWTVSPCHMLLAAGSLAAAGDTEYASQPEGIYKAKVLQELTERMRFAETAISDETLCALMFLTSFDLSRSNCEARTHLQAIQDNLVQKYPEPACVPTYFSLMLESLNLIQALTLDTPLINPSFHSLCQVSAWEISENLSSLLTADYAVYDGQARPKDAIKLRDLSKLLLSAFASVQATIINATMGGSIYDTFYESLEEFRKANCRDDPISCTAYPIARMCYHQQAILYNLIANKRPYRHTSNAKHVLGLVTETKADLHGPWQSMPFLQIMVLLTGLAASRDPRHKAFFKARLLKAIYTMGVERWPEVREFILMFLLSRDYL